MYPMQSTYGVGNQAIIYDQPLYQINHLKNGDKNKFYRHHQHLARKNISESISVETNNGSLGSTTSGGQKDYRAHISSPDNITREGFSPPPPQRSTHVNSQKSVSMMSPSSTPSQHLIDNGDIVRDDLSSSSMMSPRGDQLDNNGNSVNQDPEIAASVSPCSVTSSSSAVGNAVSGANGEEKELSCRFCKKTFSKQFFLKIHEQVHLGDKPFMCSICNKTFAQQIHLKNHQRVHTGEKPFQCEVCRKAFSQAGNLKLHLRIHSGDKPFTCEVCGKAFSQRNSLNDHQRFHTGDMFFCRFCKRPFCNQFFLENHERTHTGEKPFTCEYCARRLLNGEIIAHTCVHTLGRSHMSAIPVERHFRNEIVSMTTIGYTQGTSFIANTVRNHFAISSF